MKRIQQSLLIFFAAACLTACTEKAAPVYQEQGYVFGTLVEVSIADVADADAKLAVAAVMQEFQRLHSMLHAWQPSELSELNAALARGESAAVSSELVSIVQDAAQLAKQSHGMFNPAIGGLVGLWGFHADDFKPMQPDQNELAKLVAANPQMSDLSIDHGRIESRNPAVQLDLGGYAKGYALDRAAKILRERGIHNALINIGGNIMALGHNGKRNWRVGIQHPRKAGALASLELHDGEAIGTSGDYQRYFMLGAIRYCHLINPRTGYPMQAVQAVTILTHGKNAGALSDAASKPVFMSGVKGWRNAARLMNLDAAMLIDEQGRVHITNELKARLEFLDKNNTVSVE